MLQKIEDPAITELRRIVENALALPVKFIYANIFEVNSFMNELETEATFPCFVLWSSDKNKYKIEDTGLLTRKLQVVGWMCGRFDSATPDYSSADVQPLLYQLQQLCENLQWHCGKSYLINTNVAKPIEEFEADKLYAKSDAHLFVVGVSFTWNIQTANSGCFS
jgi:hypothetical protein